LEYLLLALVAEGVELTPRGAGKALVTAVGQVAHTLARMRSGAKPPRGQWGGDLSSLVRHLLVEQGREFDLLGELAVHVMDALLFSLDFEGIDLGGPRARTAVETAGYSVAEWLSRVED